MQKISFKVFNISFAFSWGAIITIILIGGILVRLGFWQLDRAEQKRQITQDIQSQQATVVDLNKILNEDTDLGKLVYAQAKVEGHYDTEHQFIYDNNIQQGVVGFYVLTPFKIKNTDQSILINRGWLALKSRDMIKQQNIRFKSSPDFIQGRLIKPISRFTLSQAITKLDDFPRLIQNIKLENLSQQLGYSLLPLSLELDPAEKEGYQRQWQAFYGSSDKSVAYAIQWFCFAGIFLIVMLVLHRIEPSNA